jgi:hypothetical protein
MPGFVTRRHVTEKRHAQHDLGTLERGKLRSDLRYPGEPDVAVYSPLGFNFRGLREEQLSQ